MCDDLQLKSKRRGPGALVGMELGAGLALLTMAAGSAMGLAQGPQASRPDASHDDEAQPNEPQRPDPQSTTAHAFNIPAGDLTDALDAYQKTSGVKVHTHVPADKLATFYSVGVHGVFSNETALRKLLSETGLTASPRAAGGVEITVRNSEHVEVSGETQSVSLQQFPEPLLDTAQSVNVVPQFILQDQAATSLRDGLRNVPGISIAAGEGGQQGDTLTIRGFNARNDIFLDGIRDQGSYYRDSFNFEAVDVLEGPAGVEFGRGSTGGVVNQETKLPGLRPHISGNVQLGTNEMRRFTGDLNEPLDKLLPGLDGAAFRINAAGTWSNVAERDYTNVRRWGVAPSLAFGLNSHTRGFLSYLHEGESDLPDYGLPYFGAYVLPGIARSNYYGFANGDYFKTSPDIGTGRIEHDFGLNLTVRNALRFANYPRYVNITEPQVNTTPLYRVTGAVAPVAGTTTYKLVSGTVTAQCSQTNSIAGAAACYALNTPVSQVQVLRNQLQATSTEDMLWDQASAVGHYRVGRVANDFAVIVEGGRERSRPQRLTYAKTYTNAIVPTPFDAMPSATLGVKTYVNATSYGGGFFDTLKLTSWLQASGGVRFDYFSTDYVSAPTHLSRLDKQPSYRAAIVAKPKPEGTIYFDWGTSFNPSAESLSLSATNAVQPPQYNETYEVGSKWAFLRERLNMNVSWFQTLKTNVQETDPTNSANVIPVGNQRVRGAQIGGLGRLPQHFDLIFGYAYLSGVAVNSVQNYSPFGSVSAYVNGSTTAQTVQLYIAGDPVYGTNTFYRSAIGNPFANVPKNTANLFVTHSLGWHFIGGFGFNQVGARRASSTAPVALPQTNAAYTNLSQLPTAFKVLPGYWTFNAMIKRPVTERIAFQANVNNLTNAFFIDQPHPNHLIPGEGINAQFGFNYSF